MEDQGDTQRNPSGDSGGDRRIDSLLPTLAEDIKKRRKEQREKPRNLKRLTVRWDDKNGVIVDLEFTEA